MHHPTDRIAHTTAFVAPVVEHWLEREISQWVHPMKDRSDDPSHHERMLLPRSYIQARNATYHILIHQISEIGASCSSGVRAFTHGVMGRWIDTSWWTHWLHKWCNKGMCYPVCRMVHIKEPLLLIKK